MVAHVQYSCLVPAGEWIITCQTWSLHIIHNLSVTSGQQSQCKRHDQLALAFEHGFSCLCGGNVLHCCYSRRKLHRKRLSSFLGCISSYLHSKASLWPCYFCLLSSELSKLLYVRIKPVAKWQPSYLQASIWNCWWVNRVKYEFLTFRR